MSLRQSLSRKRFLTFAILALVMLLVAFLVQARGDTQSVEIEPNYRVVVLPDTQHYSEEYPTTFYSQTNWILELTNSDSVDLVLHVGDVVNYDTDEQWSVASSALKELDGAVPYVLATGNHDFAYDESRTSKLTEYFPPERLGLNGVFEEGRSENGYRLVTMGEVEYLILSLEFFPRDEVIDWAYGILSEHQDNPTIIITHAYLFDNGMRYGQSGNPEALHGPYEYPHITGTSMGATNDAETIYQELVLPFSQVELVLSGHVLGTGASRRTDTRPDGTEVHQVLQNYQMRVDGGEGYLRIYDFYEDRIEVRTYSPLLDKWIRDNAHEFSISR